MPSMCSFMVTCSPDTTSSFSSLDDVAKIVGVVLGTILGFIFLVCIIVIIYLLFFKRKPQAQVWTHPSPRPQVYGQSMPTFSYVHYSQRPMPQPQPDPRKITEEPPPAYEEINVNEDSTTTQI